MSFWWRLGIEPRRELRDLHEAILRQDPQLDRSAPQEEERGLGVFVGRRPELAELGTGLDDAFAGRGRLFLVEGSRHREAGWPRRSSLARGEGARVLIGRCWEAGEAPACWPWTQALRAYARARSRRMLAAQLGAGAAEMLRSSRSCASAFRRCRLPRPRSPRVRASASSRRPRTFFTTPPSNGRLMVLDDLHAADGPSILLLRFLARELGTTRTLVIAAYRNVDPMLQQPLAEMVDDVTREPVTRRLELSGLSESEVAEYLALSAPGIDSFEAAGPLYGRTEGNPLFVGEIVRLLSVETAQPVEVLQASITSSRRCPISPRRLGGAPHRLGAGARVPLRRAGPPAGRRTSSCSALEEAIEAGVVSEVPGSNGRFR